MVRLVVLLCLCALALLAPSAALARDIDSPFKRCVNMGNALEASWEGEWGYYIEDAHLAEVKAAGFDAIRVPVLFVNRIGPAPDYRIDPLLLKRLDHILDRAEKLDLKVVISNHHESIHDDPDGQEARYVAMWEQLATHFADRGPNLILQLVNEPRMSARQIERLNLIGIRAIRSRTRGPWIAIAAHDWGSHKAWKTWKAPKGQHRVVLTTGYYDPIDFTHHEAPWDKDSPHRFPRAWGAPGDVAQVRRDVAEIAAGARKIGLGLFLTEMGVVKTVPVEERALWSRTVRDALEAEGIGWCAWDFAGMFPIYDVKGEAWIPLMREALLGSAPLPTPKPR